MPTLRVPFYGDYNQRSFTLAGFAGNSGQDKDQVSKATVLTAVKNALSGAVTYYVEKRSGFYSVYTLSGLSNPIIGYQLYYSPSTGHVYSYWSSAGVAHLYDSSAGPSNVDCGIMTTPGSPVWAYFSEIVLSGVTYILIANGAVGWFLASDATTGTLTQAGTTHSNTTVDGITSTTGYYVGQAYSGSGIAANTRIASIVNANSITLTIAAGTSVTANFTREAIAKIIDSDFPTDIIGGFVALDGYVAVCTSSGKVYNSDLNSVTSWAASSYLTLTQYSGNGVGVFRYKNQIVAFTRGSIEFLYNAGNATGSPFSSSVQYATDTKNDGPASPFAVTQINGTVYYIATDGNIYTLNGFTPQIIKTTGAPTGYKAVGFSVGPWCEGFVYNRMSWLNIYNTAASDNIWYCIDTGTFHAPIPNTLGSPNSPQYVHMTSGAGVTYLTAGSSGGSKIFSMLDNHLDLTGIQFTDDGNAYTMEVQIATDMGTNDRKTPTALQVVCDVQSSGNLNVSWSDDDGVTFTTARAMPMTAQINMNMTNLGSWRGIRIWKFEHNANTPWRGKLLEIDYTVSG